MEYLGDSLIVIKLGFALAIPDQTVGLNLALLCFYFVHTAPEIMVEPQPIGHLQTIQHPRVH
jgi:hypothetical protein